MQVNPLTKAEVTERVIRLGRDRTLSLAQPLVMGIINVTPDSFYDGGRHNSPDSACRQALRMIDEGADLLDIGGESSRPGAERVESREEYRRVIPAIEAIRKESDICISVDSCRAEVAEAALNAGADIINDITALRGDPQMAPLVSTKNVPVALMHMQGTPENMQKTPGYKDCLAEIHSFFEERLEFCDAVGIDRENIILDPGIGFGKRLSDNLEILARVRQLADFGRPILVGASRKSFLGMLSARMKEPEQRLAGSVASALMAVGNGADIVRVHDVHATVTALKVVRSIEEID